MACADPDAVVQPRKDGVFCPAYKPALVANEKRFIVGQRMDASSEQRSLGPLLVQYRKVIGAYPKVLLLDGSFRDRDSLKLLESLSVPALCSLGLPARSAAGRLRLRDGKFDKSAFTFDPQRDEYICPTGHPLVRRGQWQRSGQLLRQYVGVACARCPEQARCTDAREGRLLNRYEADEYRERMALRLAEPEARALLRQRSVVVEPTFAVLKTHLRLQRFHRRGLRGVAMEFALWCLAHNLWRALHLLRHSSLDCHAAKRCLP